MKNKIQKTRNIRLVIRGNPAFGMRIVKAKKGKGSYVRQCVKTFDYSEKTFKIMSLFFK